LEMFLDNWRETIHRSIKEHLCGYRNMFKASRTRGAKESLTMPTPAQSYTKALDAINRQFAKAEDEALRGLIGLLQELRRDVAEILLTATGEFEVNQVRRIQADIERSIVEFEKQAQIEMRAATAGAFDLGASSVTAPLEAAGILPSALADLNYTLLGTLQDFSADLIKDIAGDMRQQINRQLRLASLGAKTPFQIMKDVTDILGVKARDGIWGMRRRPEVVKGVAARAEAIVRTELTRIFNISHQDQATKAGKLVPGLLKRWVAAGDRRTRRSHLQAHSYYAANPIPVDQPFQIGRYVMMHPGDPTAGAEETVNCRCVMATIVPEIGILPSDLDKQVSRQLAKRKA
jgi:hypothetical protein